MLFKRASKRYNNDNLFIPFKELILLLVKLN